MTSEEARRAIYLDFEGFQERPPLMAGVLLEGGYTCTVFPDVDPLIKLAGDAKGLEAMDLERFLRDMVRQARREKRVIAAFSEHERNVIEKLGISIDGVTYANVLDLAKKWREQFHPKAHKAALAKKKKAKGKKFEDKGNSLVDFVKLIGIKIPGVFGKGKVTKRLGAVLDQLEKKGDFKLLSPGAKRGWTNLITHNTLDCEYASQLAERIVSDQAAQDIGG